MRHRVDGRKFGRTSAHREAMLRNVVSSLFEHGRITTTVPKAKEARRLAERCITIAKKGVAALNEAEANPELAELRANGEKLREQLKGTSDEAQQFELRKQITRNGKKISAITAPSVHYRRLALQKLHRKQVVDQLFEEVAPRYLERQGGYTRILKAGYRKGDNAPIALFSLV